MGISGDGGRSWTRELDVVWQSGSEPRNPHANRLVWQWVGILARVFYMGICAARAIFGL